uniref:Uncharacterized protein n=1 Tax=Sus scrofa TaxID=9823 RepID=A0A8W4F983_PIG
IYSFTVLEDRNPKSRCQQGCFLLDTLKENLFHASLMVSTGCQQSLACICITLNSASVFTWPSSLFLCLVHCCLLYKDISHWI